MKKGGRSPQKPILHDNRNECLIFKNGCITVENRTLARIRQSMFKQPYAFVASANPAGATKLTKELSFVKCNTRMSSGNFKSFK